MVLLLLQGCGGAPVRPPRIAPYEVPVHFHFYNDTRDEVPLTARWASDVDCGVLLAVPSLFGGLELDTTEVLELPPRTQYPWSLPVLEVEAGNGRFSRCVAALLEVEGGSANLFFEVSEPWNRWAELPTDLPVQEMYQLNGTVVVRPGAATPISDNGLGLLRSLLQPLRCDEASVPSWTAGAGFEGVLDASEPVGGCHRLVFEQQELELCGVEPPALPAGALVEVSRENGRLQIASGDLEWTLSERAGVAGAPTRSGCHVDTSCGPAVPSRWIVDGEGRVPGESWVDESGMETTLVWAARPLYTGCELPAWVLEVRGQGT